MENKKKKKISLHYLFYDTVKIIAGIPGLIWHRPRIYYENENASEKIRGGALVVSNHLGFFDPIYLQYAIWYRRHHFICLQKFIDGKLGWMFRHFLCIPIDKENFSINSFHEIVDHLKNDEIVSMFPEGKVNDGSGEMASFKSGAVLMSFQSRKPIIPVYIAAKRTWFERIRVIIGQPICFDSSAVSFSSMEKATAEVEEKIHSLKGILEDRICRQKAEK